VIVAGGSRGILFSVGSRTRSYCRAAAILAAVLAVAIGVGEVIRVHPSSVTEPRWSRHLTPLLRAPIRDGGVTAFIVPSGLDKLDADRLFFETVWLRPQVRWLPAKALPTSDKAAVAVLIAPPPAARPGPEESSPWQVLWHEGWITVMTRRGS